MEIIFLSGLPCSGKTSYYEETLKPTLLPDHKYVNADDLKELMYNYDPTVVGMYASEAIKAAGDLVIRLLQTKVDQIVMDAGSINSSYTPSLLAFAKEIGYKTRMIFIDTPYDICVARNELRERKVPKSLISSKALKREYLWENYKSSEDVDEWKVIPYFTRENLFFDMDGVLAANLNLPKIDGKLDFVNSKYFVNLPVVEEVKTRVKDLINLGKNIFILSASPTSISGKEKLGWLKKHFSFIPQENIFFVNKGIHKAEMFSDLAEYLKLEKSSMCLIEDTHHIIRECRETYQMDSIHVSEFLTTF